MAKFDNTPITTNVRNSIDNETFARWRTLNIAKKKVGENKSNTLAQQKQRLRMEKVVELSAPFDVAAQIGFPGKKSVEDYVNAFVGDVAEVGEIVDDNDFTVEFMGRGFDVVYDMLLISFGSYCIGIYFRSVQAIRKDVSFSGLLLAVTELKLFV